MGKTKLAINDSLKGLFNGDLFKRQNLLNDSDIAALKAYNAELEKVIGYEVKNGQVLPVTTSAQTAFNRTMQNASVDAQNMAASANGMIVNLDQIPQASKAAELGLKALRIAGNMLLMWGISEAITLIRDCATASDRLKESASDLGSQFSSTKSDIEGYKTKISDLYEVINDSSSSYEDTYNARQELLTIQDEMIEKFGSEADAVQLVTNAIKGQTQVLDDLAKDKWQETVNEFVSGSDKKWTERVGDSWANLWSGTSNNFDRMVKEMENAEISFRVVPRYDDDGTYEEFSNKLKEIFGAEITHTQRDDIFTLSGDLKDIYAQLLNIQSLANNLGIDDSFLPDLSRQADEVKNTLESYQEIYSQHILYDKIFDNDAYEDSFNKINEEYKKYQDAFASGNEDAIEKAKQSFAEVVQGATEGIDDQSVIDYFNSMYPDLQEVVGGWEFEVKFKAAIDDNSDDFEDEVKDKLSYFNTSDEIINFNAATATDEQITAYTELNEIADTYSLTLDQLIAKLEKLGLISSVVDKDLQNSIRQITDNRGISDRDETARLEAYTRGFTEEQKRLWLEATRGAKNATQAIEMYEAALAKAKNEAANETGISFPISDTVNQLNTRLKPAIDSLQSTYQSIFTDDGFALNSIDILSTCDAIKSKLDEMAELELDVDYSAYEDFVRVLSNTESTEQDVQNAFNSLADSITQAALTGKEDVQTLNAALEDLGISFVVNDELVAFQELINNTTALEETITQAGLTMDEFVISTEDGTIVASEAAQAFIEEMVGAENCKQALALLQLQQMLCNENSLNTTDDVNACLTLAKAAGVAVESLRWLANVSAQYDAAVAAGDTVAMKNLEATMGMIRAKINDELASFTPVGVDFSGVGKGAKSAGKKAGKDYKDALKEELSDLEGIISGITGKIDDQISSINEQKSAALDAIESQIDALEEERDARLAVIEAQKKQLEEQIKAIEEQVKAKQDEIDAIQDAADAREREINLQKAQYELERMQNQRTMLVYSEDRGMHYRTDESGIRDAKEEVDSAKREIEIADIEKQIDLLEDQKDLLNEQIDLLDKQADKINEFYDAQIKALEKQKEQAEKYFESIIESLENSKSKYEELMEIVDKAELSAKLKQLGIDEEALLNGSEEEFNKLKDAYMNIVFQLNEGNGEVLNALRELSGYEGTAPSVLEESNNKLDEMNGKLDESNTSVGTVNDSLSETATTTSGVATNVGDITTNLTEANALVIEEQTAFSNLKTKIDEVIEAINQKTKAIQEEQGTVATATGSELANLELLKNKILEIKETLESFGTPEEGLISNIATAINSLNEISLEEGLIAQFTNLKTAIDEVATAISGGGEENSSGEQSGGSAKGGGKSGGSKGESGGGLTGAIEQIGDTAKKVIGEPDVEGDGTVIGEFGALETAITDVTSAIGGGESESDKGQNKGSDNESVNLIGSIVNLGETSEETLGESGGDGVIGRFEEFEDVIEDAKNQVEGIADGLAEIDGTTVECTIKIHVESDGFPAYASGTALGSMNLESKEYTPKYEGNSHVSGTANVTGNWGVRKGGKSLVGELGQELWVHSASGTFETVGDNGPEWIMAEKGDIIFNHLQTKELLDKGNIVKTGKAFANGTIQYSDGSVITPEGHALRPPIPGERGYDLMKAGEALIKKWKESGEEVFSNAVFEGQRQMEKWTKEITNNQVINNIANNRNVQQPIHNEIYVTLPNVTNSTSAESLLRDLESINTKKYQVNW